MTPDMGTMGETVAPLTTSNNSSAATDSSPFTYVRKLKLTLQNNQ